MGFLFLPALPAGQSRGCQWGWCDRSNSSLSTPGFPAAGTCHPCLIKHPGTGAGMLSCFPGHVEGAESTPEMRCEENPAPLERTGRKLRAAQVTGAAPCQGKSLENEMGIARYTRYQLWKIFLLLWCFLLLKKGEAWNESWSCTDSKDFKAHLLMCSGSTFPTPQQYPNLALPSCSSLQITQIILTSCWAKSKLFHEFYTP